MWFFCEDSIRSLSALFFGLVHIEINRLFFLTASDLRRFFLRLCLAKLVLAARLPGQTSRLAVRADRAGRLREPIKTRQNKFFSAITTQVLFANKFDLAGTQGLLRIANLRMAIWQVFQFVFCTLKRQWNNWRGNLKPKSKSSNRMTSTCQKRVKSLLACLRDPPNFPNS